MVPCGAVFTGDPKDSEFGHFFHYNTVQEVAVTFGANNGCCKASDLRHPTAARVTPSCETPPIPNIHPDDDHPASVGGRGQNEAILFRCQKCHEELLRHEYNATPKGVDGYDPSQWAAR